jgi:hypothetical protein
MYAFLERMLKLKLVRVLFHFRWSYVILYHRPSITLSTLPMIVMKSQISRTRPILTSAFGKKTGVRWHWCMKSWRCVDWPFMIRTLILPVRSPLQQSKHFQVPKSRQCFEQSLSLSFCRSHGTTWPTFHSFLNWKMPFAKAWQTLTNGITRSMTQMHTSFVLVCFTIYFR